MNETVKERDCIVLQSASKGALPVGLEQALNERGWSGRTFDYPHRAFAELCLARQGERLRRAHGQSTSVPVLVIVERPADDVLCDQLLAARQRYLPDVPAWSWNEAGLTLLASGTSEDAGERQGGTRDGMSGGGMSEGSSAGGTDRGTSEDAMSSGWSVGTTAPGAGGSPSLRLTGEMPAESSGGDSHSDEIDSAAAADDASASATERLSQEEVSMLLDQSPPVPEEATR